MADLFDDTPASAPEPNVGSPDGTPSGEPAEGEARTLSFVLSLIVVPLLVVLVGTGLLMAFGMMTYERAEPQDFIHQLQSGNANRRWQAAYELSKRIAYDPDALRAQQVGPVLIEAFQEVAGETEEERTLRRYLALCMGTLGDPVAVPVLREALDDPDSETRIFVIAALGHLGAIEAAPDLIALLGDEDPGIVKAAAYSLGAFETPEVANALVDLLEHGVADVRWNAAVALATHGDRRAAPVLFTMLDREGLSRVPNIEPAQIDDVMTTAIQSAAALHLDDFREILAGLAENDPNLRVRSAALQALARLDARAGERRTMAQAGTAPEAGKE